MKKFFLVISAITLSFGALAHTQSPAHIQKVGISPEIPVQIQIKNGRRYDGDFLLYMDKKKLGSVLIASGSSKKVTIGVKVKPDEERSVHICSEYHPVNSYIASFISKVCTLVQVYRYPETTTHEK